MELKKGKWTNEELELLESYRGIYTPKQIAAKLNRSLAGVRERIKNNTKKGFIEFRG